MPGYATREFERVKDFEYYEEETLDTCPLVVDDTYTAAYALNYTAKKVRVVDSDSFNLSFLRSRLKPGLVEYLIVGAYDQGEQEATWLNRV